MLLEIKFAQESKRNWERLKKIVDSVLYSEKGPWKNENKSRKTDWLNWRKKEISSGERLRSEETDADIKGNMRFWRPE